MQDHTKHRKQKPIQTLYAFYDLSVSPATFDITTFIALAEIGRKNQGCDSIHVIIVPGPREGFRDDNFTPYDSENKKWRLYHIMVPCCWLLPSCQNVTLFETREEAMLFEKSIAEHIFPKEYSVQAPVEKYLLKHMVDAPALSVLRSTPSARKIIRKWIKTHAGNRKMITITLRECSYQEDRNSNLEEWGEFARSLDRNIFCPVVIRDAETVHDPIPPELSGILCFSDVVWNIDLRTALYELAYLNLFVNNGPSALCNLIQKASSLTFKMITPTAYSTSEKFFLANGFKPGSQLKSIAPFHQWIWEDDQYETIVKEFERMSAEIENAPAEAGRGE